MTEAPGGTELGWGLLAPGGSCGSPPSTTALSPGPGVGAGALRGGAVIAAPAHPAPDSQGTDGASVCSWHRTRPL